MKVYNVKFPEGVKEYIVVCYDDGKAFYAGSTNNATQARMMAQRTYKGMVVLKYSVELVKGAE